MWSIEQPTSIELDHVERRSPVYAKELLPELQVFKCRYMNELYEAMIKSGGDASSPSATTNSIEGPVTVRQTGSTAFTIPSKKELEGLVRDATSRLLSPEEVIDQILPWVESRAKLLEILGKTKKEAKIELSESFVEILQQKAIDFWDGEVSLLMLSYRPSFLIHPIRSLRVASSQNLPITMQFVIFYNKMHSRTKWV